MKSRVVPLANPSFSFRSTQTGQRMNVVELTRALVDIESISGNEAQVGEYLFDCVSNLAATTGGRCERMEVEAGRFNVFASWGEPAVTLSTHMDTVPPFFPSREDAEFIWGRGSCDAKGIIASMFVAAEKLRADEVRNFGLLFVVGEERNSAGAPGGGEVAAGFAVPGQWRAHRKQAGAGVERRAAIRNCCAWQDGALGLSGAGRLGHRSFARRARSDSPRAASER